MARELPVLVAGDADTRDSVLDAWDSVLDAWDSVLDARDSVLDAWGNCKREVGCFAQSLWLSRCWCLKKTAAASRTFLNNCSS